MYIQGEPIELSAHHQSPRPSYVQERTRHTEHKTCKSVSELSQMSCQRAVKKKKKKKKPRVTGELICSTLSKRSPKDQEKPRALSTCLWLAFSPGDCCPLLTKSAYGSLPSRQDAQLWALSLCIQNTGEVSQSHSYCSLLRCPLPSTASAETQSSGPARVPGT